MKFYMLTGTKGGTLPRSPWIRLGAIVCVPAGDFTTPGAQWNPDEAEWVTPIWTEVSDPSGGIK